MTVRPAVIVVAVAVLVAGAVAAAPASGGTVKRSSSAATKKACTKQPSQRARAACRRARASAGYRRGARRGRALLAPRVTRPTATGTGVAAPDPVVPGQPAPPTGVAPSPPSPTDPAPVASTIGAEAYDFTSFVLRLTKTSVPAGNLTIYFRNYDVSDHNLWIDPPSGAGAPTQISPAVGEGGGATKTVAVTPGTWRFYCSLLGHEAMTQDLTVQ